MVGRSALNTTLAARGDACLCTYTCARATECKQEG